MNSREEWEANNERFLKAALDWIRLLLTRLGERVEPTPLPQTRPSNPFNRRVAAGIEHVSDQQIGQAARAMELAAAYEPPPLLIVLGKRLDASPFELALLMLCMTMELDTGIANLCAWAQADPSRTYPTFALAMSLASKRRSEEDDYEFRRLHPISFDRPGWDVTWAERPLRFWRLIEINQPNNEPLITSALRADERIVQYLRGLNDKLDERLTRLISPMIGDDGDLLPASHERTVEQIIQAMKARLPGTIPPIIQLLGIDGLSKQIVAQRCAAIAGITLFRLSEGWIPTSAGEVDNLIRLWQRETRLVPIGLYLEVQEAHDDSHEQAHLQALRRLLEQYDGFIFLDTSEQWGELTRASVMVETGRPTTDEQKSAWTELVEPDAAEELANQFNLSLPTIRQIGSTTLQSGRHDLRERLWTACLMYSRQRLDILAQRIETKANWDDLVLPKDEKDLLHQIVNQVEQRSAVYQQWELQQRMNRGLGLSVLFAGESGTGKTLAAEVTAHRLKLNLYRIDLSSVVSKYIGETEKNLRALFDAAEYGGTILFFDEADALFGKRSEVKDSHDRYANIEINYLLQRMEAFQGLAILATNMKSALDTAFLRRLRFIVNFPFPSSDERKKIWEKAFPTPRSGEKPHLDYDWLARLSLTGGNIQTIALNTMFLAAQNEVPIDMALVLKAAKTEYRKLDKPINEADFVWKKGHWA